MQGPCALGHRAETKAAPSPSLRLSETRTLFWGRHPGKEGRYVSLLLPHASRAATLPSASPALSKKKLMCLESLLLI